MIRLVLLGGPGSGKGTQADILKQKYQLVKLSTGDLLRKETEKNTDLGREARLYMDKGELVPDAVMIGILRKITAGFESKGQGYILDGFPRTVPQAEALLKMLEKQDVELTMALLIDVPEEELVRRLTSRWTCRECSATVSFPDGKPEDAKCPKCGGELYQREDDKEATILKRLNVYKENTAPLIGFFRERGLLERVDGNAVPGTVSERIQDLFEKKGIK
ncbi:MAG: adenylate kinase [Candidatus Marinimicrobia bacterium]|nr:adenylate kinase [Candidatus Neomarinimicrobiota bacterium]